jgi:hypothetical protein
MGLENNKNTLWKCLFEKSHQSGEKNVRLSGLVLNRLLKNVTISTGKRLSCSRISTFVLLEYFRTVV